MILDAGNVAPCRQSDIWPVLERLWMGNYTMRPAKRSSALSSHTHNKGSGKPTFRLCLRKEVHILVSIFKAIHTNKVAQRKGWYTQRVTSSQWFLQFWIAIGSTDRERPGGTPGKNWRHQSQNTLVRISDALDTDVRTRPLSVTFIAPFILEHKKYQIRKLPHHMDSKTSNLTGWCLRPSKSISSQLRKTQGARFQNRCWSKTRWAHIILHGGFSRGTRTNWWREVSRQKLPFRSFPTHLNSSTRYPKSSSMLQSRATMRSPTRGYHREKCHARKCHARNCHVEFSWLHRGFLDYFQCYSLVQQCAQQHKHGTKCHARHCHVDLFDAVQRDIQSFLHCNDHVQTHAEQHVVMTTRSVMPGIAMLDFS